MQDYIAASAAAALNIPISQIETRLRQPRGYQTHTLFDVTAPGRHLIAKRYTLQDGQDDAPRREFAALKLVAGLGLAPQPVWCDGRSLVLYEFLPGQVWDRRAATPAEMSALAEVWLRVGRVGAAQMGPSTLFARLQNPSARAKLLDVEPYAAWASQRARTRRAAELCRTAAHRAGEALRKLERYAPVLRFCKCDPRFGNVLARPHGRIGLTDWEDCGLQDPAIEIADLFTAPNQEDLLSPEAKAALLNGLREWDDGTLAQRVALYEIALLGTWFPVLTRVGLRHLANGALAGWEINEMPYAARLRRMLARIFASDAFADVEFFE